MIETDVVIQGGSIAAMVTALELSLHNKKCVIINKGNRWGGHFSDINFNGKLFDPGMLLYEFTSFNSQSNNVDIRNFDISSTNDVGRFCNTLNSFISTYQETRIIETPCMLLNGQIYDDFVIANELSSLKNLPYKEKIKNELKIITNQIKDENSYHPKNKLSSKAYKNASYSNISRRIHGKTMHEEIWEPLCKKAIGIKSDFLLANYHRKAWLPLYYPETLLSAIEEKDHYLPETKFSYPRNTTIGNISFLILKKIKESSNINIYNDNIKTFKKLSTNRYSVESDLGLEINTSNLIWTGKLDSLLKTSSISSKSSKIKNSDHYILFITISKNDLNRLFSVLFTIDKSTFIYRIQNQTFCMNKDSDEISLSIEVSSYFLSKNYGKVPPNDFNKKIIEELIKLLIIKENTTPIFIKGMYLENSVPIPSLENLGFFKSDYKEASNLLESEFMIGLSSGFASNSINHQILQGIKTADLLY